MTPSDYKKTGGVKPPTEMQVCELTGGYRSSRKGRGLPSLLAFDAIQDLWNLPEKTRDYLWDNKGEPISRDFPLCTLENCRRLHYAAMVMVHYSLGHEMPARFIGGFDVSIIAMIEVSKHYEGGVLAGYDARNWEKGLPISWYIDSLWRHVGEYSLGKTDEPHLRAALWNAQCLHATALRIIRGQLPAGLNDMPDLWLPQNIAAVEYRMASLSSRPPMYMVTPDGTPKPPAYDEHGCYKS